MKFAKTKLLMALVAIVCVFAIFLTACGEEKNPGDSTNPTAEKTVSKIEIVQAPTKLVYQEGEMLDLTGLKVNVVYSDGSKEDVTSKCTTNITAPLKAQNTSFYVIYKYNEDGKTKQKNAPVSITVNAEVLVGPEINEKISITWETLPKNVVKTSKAPMLFYTYYDSTTMNCEATLELTPASEGANNGTFRFIEENGIASSDGIGNEVKLGIIEGEYTIEGDVMTLQSKSLRTSSNTAKYASATKEVATIVKEGNKIIGLNFGSMAGDNTFWGWSKSKASAFVEGLSTRYSLPADVVYMEAIFNNVVPEYMKTYYEVESIRFADDMTVKTEYFEGQEFDATGLALVIDFKVPAGSLGEDSSEAKYKGIRLDKGYTLSLSTLAVSDTKVIVNFDGATLELPITVKARPSEAELMDLTVNVEKWETKYLPWQDNTVASRIAELGLQVTAVYSDDTTKVVTNYTIENSDALVNGELTSLVVSYQEGEIKVTKNVTVAATAYNPFEYAKAANAEYAFVTSYLKGTNKVNVGITLNNGKYVVYCWQTKSTKSAVVMGEYTMDGDQVTFLKGECQFTLGSSTVGAITGFNAADRTATLLRKDGKVVALYSEANNVFFGHSWDKIDESTATSYTDGSGNAYASTVVYCPIVEGNAKPEGYNDYFDSAEVVPAIPAPMTSYTVSFETNGGSEVPAQSVLSGTKLAAVKTEKESSEFAGWYKDAELTQAFDFDQVITSDLTLYAKWNTLATYTVSFETNGGSEVPAQTVNENTLIEEVTTTRENHIFLGWYKDAELTVEFNPAQDAVTSDLTLYAKWEEIAGPAVLTGISVNTSKWDVKYVNGKEEKVSDRIAELGLQVTANYSDGSSKEVSAYQVSGTDAVLASAEKLTVSYEEDGVSVSAEIAVSAKAYTPTEYAYASKADYVFLSSFTKDSNKVNVCVELFKGEEEGKGRFVHYSYGAKTKGFYITGNYTIEGDTISFTDQVLVAWGSSSMFKADNNSATVVKKDGEIVGIYFGEMTAEPGFWGYSATKASAFKASTATAYTDAEGNAYAATHAYLAIVEKETTETGEYKLPAGYVDYYAA